MSVWNWGIFDIESVAVKADWPGAGGRRTGFDALGGTCMVEKEGYEKKQGGGESG
jgi:hypothetical protein